MFRPPASIYYDCLDFWLIERQYVKFYPLLISSTFLIGGNPSNDTPSFILCVACRNRRKSQVFFLRKSKICLNGRRCFDDLSCLRFIQSAKSKEKGNAAFEKGRFDDAIQHFNRAIFLTPKYASALEYCLNTCYLVVMPTFPALAAENLGQFCRYNALFYLNPLRRYVARMLC